METIVRNVRDLGEIDRSLFERVIGHPLSENAQLVIQVKNAAPRAAATSRKLPAWCNVYEGLSESEIDDLDQAIVRNHSGGEFS